MSEMALRLGAQVVAAAQERVEERRVERDQRAHRPRAQVARQERGEDGDERHERGLHRAAVEHHSYSEAQ